MRNHLRIAGMPYDVGKIGVPDDMLKNRCVWMLTKSLRCKNTR